MFNVRYNAGMDTNIHTVAKKIQHFSGAEWKGYLRADEANLLKEAGAIFSANDRADMEKFVASGHTKPKWWYFKLTENMRRALNAM